MITTNRKIASILVFLQQPGQFGEVGRTGVAIDTLDDVERLLQDIPLEKVPVFLAANGTAAILYSKSHKRRHGADFGIAPAARLRNAGCPAVPTR